jgi:hypothetical protein
MKNLQQPQTAIIPMLYMKDLGAAIDFYKKAFVPRNGGELIMRGMSMWPRCPLHLFFSECMRKLEETVS